MKAFRWIAHTAAVITLAGQALAQNPVSAQSPAFTPNPGAESAYTPPAAVRDIVIPAPVLAAALLPDDRGATVVGRFLRGPDLEPRAAAERGIALILALKAMAGESAGDFAAAGDLVQRLATDYLNALRIFELGIARGFVPPEGTLSFDFGPAGSVIHAGFLGVAPGDERLAGTLVGHAREDGDGDAMLTDGISGITRITARLPTGTYRLLLISEPDGGAQAGASPFGLEVRVNDEPFPVLPMQSQEWIQTAYLSSPDDGFAESGFRPGGRGTTRTGAALAATRGGALVIEAATRPGPTGDGELVIEIIPGPDAPPYLVGLFTESTDGPSNFSTASRGQRMLLSGDERLALEGELLAALADLLAGIATAAGPGAPPPAFLTVPEFVTPPTTVVSAS